MKVLKFFRIPTNVQSFLLPFSQSRVPYLRKRSKSPGLRHHPLCRRSNLQLIQSHVAPSPGPPARILSPLFFQVKSLLLPKSRGKREHPKVVWSSPRMAAAPGFKSQQQSSSAAPLPAPPTICYTCLHSRSLPALLGYHSKSGQVWPHGVEPIISKLSCRPCNQGELPPSYILGGSHFHPPGSKHSHSSLTYP